MNPLDEKPNTDTIANFRRLFAPTNSNTFAKVLMALCFTCDPSQQSLAITQLFGLTSSKSAPSSLAVSRIFSHPFNGSSLGLTQISSQSSEAEVSNQVTRLLHEKGMPQVYTVSPKHKKKSDFNGHMIHQFNFFFKDFQVCDLGVKVHLFLRQNPIIVGSYPTVPPPFEDLSNPMWPSLNSVWSTLSEVLVNYGTKPQRHGAEKCLYFNGGSITPVWKIYVEAQGLFYAAYGDDTEIYRLDKRYFQVQGLTQFYKVNPVDPSGLTTQNFEFNGDSYLNSQKVTTKPNGIERISSQDHEFAVSVDHPNFAEVNVFSQVSLMINWFENKGYIWKEGEVLTLKIHESLVTEDGSSTPNNALYLPREYTGAEDVPSISLGDGDGESLTNLALDADVSGHELGHHLVYESVKSTRLVENEDGTESLSEDHSGVIHEGYADYFIAAKTGNSCLGESICPGTGYSCVQKGQCLRNAENTITYKSETYWGLGSGAIHLKGQMISGLLWDLRNHIDTNADEFDELVLKSIEFLDTYTTYHIFILALISSDHTYYNGKYSCTIAEQASERGFSDQVATIIPDCTNFELPANEESTDSGEENNTSAVLLTKKREKRTLICGVITLENGLASGSLFLTLLLFMAAPLVSALSVYFKNGNKKI